MPKYVEYIKVGTDESWQVRDPDAHTQISTLTETVENHGTRISNTESSLANKQNSLGYTPVRQGGGANQGSNTVYIGWGTDNALRAQVDNTDLGPFMLKNAPWYLSSNQYGTELPAAGTAGRIFFKKV